MKKQYQLPREFGEKWVEALKTTPESKHGQRRYYDSATDCYCGIGLGFKVNGIKTNGVTVCDDDFEKDPFVQHGSKIPLWFELTKLNDLEGYTFKQLAEYVTENVEFI